jgi:hypothetical protein
VLSARATEKSVQNTGVDSLRISATSDDFARNRSDLNRVFLRVIHRGGTDSVAEFLDNSTFFNGGTHSGF